jgi:hypothetical protein
MKEIEGILQDSQIVCCPTIERISQAAWQARGICSFFKILRHHLQKPLSLSGNPILYFS